MSWQGKVLLFLDGNATVEGCILMAALGYGGNLYPRFGPHACIGKDGSIGVLFWDGKGHYAGQIPLAKVAPHIGKIDKFRDQFRRIADKTKLDDGDRREMFSVLKKWFYADERESQDIKL